MTRVRGLLHPSEIQAVVRHNYPAFRACYQHGLLRQPDLSGAVATAFRISNTGDVLEARVDWTTLADRETVDCIVHEFAILRFPAPDAGVVDVSYPIHFSPGTDGASPLDGSTR